MSLEEIRKFLRERGLEAVPTGGPATGTLSDFISWTPENTQFIQFTGGDFPDGITIISANAGCEFTTAKFSDAFTSCNAVDLSNSQVLNLTIPATTETLYLNNAGSNAPLVCALPAGLQDLIVSGAQYSSLPALPAALQLLDASDCPGLTNLPALPASLHSLYINQTPIATVPAIPAATLEIIATDCGWDATMVNAILVNLAANGANGGTIDLTGTNAAPNGPGLAAKTTLLTRGWGVTTN